MLLVVWFCVQVVQLVSDVTPILPSLSVLRLGWNRLTSLSKHSFSACPGLTELYLNNNSMASLSNHTFSGLNKLEVGLLENIRDVVTYANVTLSTSLVPFLFPNL